MTTSPATLPVDLDVLAQWMDTQGLERGPILEPTLLTGGTQNILLKFRRGDRGFVLRRPPLHLRANSNETMRREARVLGALADSDVPHPKLIAACPTEDVLGASFYLMEPIEGFNAVVKLPPLHASDPAIRRQMGFSMVDGILALSRVDYAAVGLSDLGKTTNYLERQVARWQAQLESYKEFERWPGPGEIPGIDHVASWLETNRPKDFQPGIIHGDFHLANVMFRYDGPQLAAIIDWELTTIGDPLLDLGWLLCTWPDKHSPALDDLEVHPWEGFPTNEELVAHYAAGTTRDLSAITWYGVLACYKLGIILEGTHARACMGKAPKETGDKLHKQTLSLFKRALRWIEES